MKRRIEALLHQALAAAIAAGDLSEASAGHTGAVDDPRDPAWGDLACDLPMVVAATLRSSSLEVATILQRHVPDPGGWFSSVEVGGPGFLNLRFAPAFWYAVLAAARHPDYGRSPAGCGRRVRVPIADRVTSELSAAEWRTALVAEASAGALAATGYDVERVAGRGGRYLRGPGPVALLLREGPAIREVAAERLLAAVPPATARFLLLAQPLDRPVVVDVELARRERVENPAFYVAYAIERCRRVLRNARSEEHDLGDEPLTAPAIDTLRVLARYPDVLERAASAWEPHRLIVTTIELAAAFHRYYNLDRVLAEGRALTPMRFAMTRSVCQVLEGTLRLVGVTVPGDG